MVYNNEVDKPMNYKFHRFRIYLYEIAFKLVPQHLYSTKATNFRESGKRKQHGSLHRSTNYLMDEKAKD